MATSKITYQSIPVYNYSYTANAILPSVAIFTDAYRKIPVWTLSDWMTFFFELRKKYGEADAKVKWAWWWNLGKSKSANGMGDSRAGSGLVYDSVPNWIYDVDFNNFLDKYKLHDAVYTGVGGSIANAVANPILGTEEVVSDLGSAITTTAKVLKYGIPILIIATVGLMIAYGVKKVKNA